VPYNYNFCEDGEWFSVDRWENPCGHLDTYRECWQESRQLAAPAAGEQIKCL
jgi:hypothetical protein